MLKIIHLSNGCLKISTTTNDYNFTMVKTVCSLDDSQTSLVYVGQVLIQADEGSIYELQYFKKKYGM